MASSNPSRVHPRHADLVEHLGEYLADIGRSARWLGIVTENNPRLVPGLIRGQTYRRDIMRSLCQRLVDHYTAQLALEAGTIPLAA